jgi:hypothetical protein
VEGGELWAQKWCESKLPLTGLQSRAYIVSNPRAGSGCPLGVEPRPNLKEDSVNEKGPVAETSSQYIN